MEITARVSNERGAHTVELQTGAQAYSLGIPPKPEGSGSSVNGGELLFLALATCYCNDIYREARQLRRRFLPVRPAPLALLQGGMISLL